MSHHLAEVAVDTVWGSVLIPGTLVIAWVTARGTWRCGTRAVRWLRGRKTA